MTVWAAPEDRKPTFEEGKSKVDAEGKPLRKGDRFGPSWSNHWVKVELSLPAQMRNLDQEIICKYMAYFLQSVIHGG